MTAQPALPLHMCPMAYILSADQQWPGELASSSSRARVGAVSQSRRTLYCSCTRCARLRLARRRCRAHACLPARLASLRHVHMWALPRILAERYHHTVRVQTCSHACDLSSTLHMFLQACCTCMLSACDSIPRVFTRTRRVPAGLKTRRSRLRAARRRCPAAACMPVLLAS